MIFKDRDKLSPRYLPEKLPHRENEINLLRSFFKDIYPLENVFTRIIQLQGPAGTGKTSTALHTFRGIEGEAKRKGYNVKTVHINLKLEATTKFVVYSSIARKIDPNITARSVSAEEMLSFILRYLKENSTFIFLIVDEVDYYVKTSRKTDLVFDLTRLSELHFGEPINILGLIFIARDPDWRKQLDRAELSSLGNIVINFKPYTKDEVYDIISYRSQEAFQPKAISDDVLEYVSDVTVDYAKSDLRFALDILLYAGTLAENQGSDHVTLEHVRNVLSQLEPSLTSEDIMNLNRNERIVLLSIAQTLKMNNISYADLEDVYAVLRDNCRYYKIKVLSRRSYNNAVQSLYNKGIIDLKGLKIGISNVPVEKLVKFLDYIINMLRQEI